jgi:diguanylate cyclase (GGDEF)-like protein
LEYDLGAYLLLDEGRLKAEIVPLGILEEGFVDRFKARILDNWRSLSPKEAAGDVDVEVRPGGFDGEITYSEGMRVYHTPIIDRGSPTGILYVGYLSGNGDELINRILPLVGSHASAAIEKIRIYLETKELAEKDGLTNVYNFRYFSKQFIDEVKRSRRYKHPLSLLMIDLDHLKEFNDRFGHGEGNRLLRTVADLIRSNIRDVDCIARFGGDEFVVILPETPRHEAEEVAGRILKAIRDYRYTARNQVWRISVSIGLGSYPDIQLKSAKDFFMRTDEALYQAKSRGRDQLYAYQQK